VGQFRPPRRRIRRVFSGSCPVRIGPRGSFLEGCSNPTVQLKSVNTVYYKLDEQGALMDESGSGTQFTAVGGPTETDGLVYGTSVEFVRASAQYLKIPAAQGDALGLPTDDQAFTVAGWFKLTAKSDYYSLFARVDGAAGKDGTYVIYRWHANDRYSFYVGNNTAFAQVFAGNYGDTVVGDKVFIVCWHDPDADTINIQVNDGTPDSAAWAGGTQGLGSQEGSGVTNVGALANTFDRADVIAGPVYKFNSVLSAQHRSDLYNAGSGVMVLPSGIAALNPVWFKLDGLDSIRVDSGPLGLHLTDNGAVASAPGHVHVRAADFELSNVEHLSVSNNDAFTFVGGKTYAVWFKAESLPAVAMVWGHHTDDGKQYSFFGHDSGAWKFQTGRGASATVVTESADVATGTDVLAIAWFDPVRDKLFLQINSNPPVSSDSPDVPSTYFLNDTSTPLNLGRRTLPSDNNYWDGTVGPLAILDGVLTAAQRALLWNGGAGLALF